MKYKLIPSLRWWDTTGYFPGIPGKRNPSTAQDDFDEANFTVSLYIDLDNSTNPSTADFTSLFIDNLQAFGNGPPDPDDQVNGTSTTSVSSTSTTSINIISTTSALPPPSSPSAADSCGDWYKFLFDHFEIYGKNFDANKIGIDGSGLKQQIKGM